MKAVVCTKYGPPEVQKLEDEEKPVPKDDESDYKAGPINSCQFLNKSPYMSF